MSPSDLPVTQPTVSQPALKGNGIGRVKRHCCWQRARHAERVGHCRVRGHEERRD